MGGTHCPQLLRLTLEIWEWCEQRKLFLIAQHIPGVTNIPADIESRATRDWNDWKLDPALIRPLITECQVDLFASRLSHQLPQYVSWRPDPNAMFTDAFTVSWSNLKAYAFPPFNLIQAVLQKSKTRERNSGISSPSVVSPAMVASPNRDVDRLPGLLRQRFSPSERHVRSNSGTPAISQSQIGRMESIRQRYTTAGLSGTAIELLSKSVKASTTKSYNCSWSAWSSWCSKRQRDPILVPIEDILTFLAELFSEGKEYRTLNVFRSAISSGHTHINGKPVGQHPLVIRLLKGVSISRPPQPRYQLTWNVKTITDFISALGDNLSLSLKQLTHKLCMLMALTCPERSSIMATLDIRFIHHYPEGVKFFLTTYRKRSHQGSLGESVYPAFPQNLLLCPVQCLSVYLEKTKGWRQIFDNSQPLFLAVKKAHKPVSSATISRWLKDIIQKAGINHDIFKGHSVRGASTSAAKCAGLSISTILSMADWTSSSKFNKFYYKPSLPISYGTAVLSTS